MGEQRSLYYQLKKVQSNIFVNNLLPSETSQHDSRLLKYIFQLTL